MRIINSVAAAAFLMGVAALPFQAKADYLFSGSGPNGTLASAGEPWAFGSAAGFFFWGTSGFGVDDSHYGESQPAIGLDLTFTGGGPIDSGSIVAGKITCTFGTPGCGISPFRISPWDAILTGEDTVSFQAPTAADLTDGDPYIFVIFFNDSAPTSFTGRWVTAASSVPEPGALVLFGTALAGLAGLGPAIRRRRK